MTVAAYGMVICGTDNVHRRYRGRIEKVKFGIPINEAFSHDIPATLLVLLLKVNKEGPLKKDIWRAPGNQIQVRKLSAIMQQGRLVNISNISVYTAASVLKKFLSKLPGGIFGADNEKQLFSIVQQQQQLSDEEQRKIFCRVICSLSQPSQHLLVLLFGTFRVISDSAETFGTRMNADAIGISVAPSLFHTCIHDQRAKLEDVMRFKMASQVITKIIQGFGYTNLFPRECYEFYARITGRTLRVDEQWNFTFQFPSNAFLSAAATAAAVAKSPMMSPTVAAGGVKLRKSASGLSAGSGGVAARRRKSSSSTTVSSMISSLQVACVAAAVAAAAAEDESYLMKTDEKNQASAATSVGDVLRDETNRILGAESSSIHSNKGAKIVGDYATPFHFRATQSGHFGLSDYSTMLEREKKDAAVCCGGNNEPSATDKFSAPLAGTKTTRALLSARQPIFKSAVTSTSYLPYFKNDARQYYSKYSTGKHADDENNLMKQHIQRARSFKHTNESSVCGIAGAAAAEEQENLGVKPFYSSMSANLESRRNVSKNVSDAFLPQTSTKLESNVESRIFPKEDVTEFADVSESPMARATIFDSPVAQAMNLRVSSSAIIQQQRRQQEREELKQQSPEALRLRQFDNKDENLIFKRTGPITSIPKFTSVSTSAFSEQMNGRQTSESAFSRLTIKSPLKAGSCLSDDAQQRKAAPSSSGNIGTTTSGYSGSKKFSESVKSRSLVNDRRAEVGKLWCKQSSTHSLHQDQPSVSYGNTANAKSATTPFVLCSSSSGFKTMDDCGENRTNAGVRGSATNISVDSASSGSHFLNRYGFDTTNSANGRTSAADSSAIKQQPEYYNNNNGAYLQLQQHYPTESLQRRINAYCTAANILKPISAAHLKPMQLIGNNSAQHTQPQLQPQSQHKQYKTTTTEDDLLKR